MPKQLTIRTLCGLALLCLAHPAWAIVIASGDTNNTPPSPDPGFNSVGRATAGFGGVVYVGNGWCLTAAHVTIANEYNSLPQFIQFPAGSYTVDETTLSFANVLRNADNSLADVKMFRLNGDTSALVGVPIASGSPADGSNILMVGQGRHAGDAEYWHADKTDPDNWVWNTQSPPGSPGPDDYAGFQTIGEGMRWGENISDGTLPYTFGTPDFGTNIFFSRFDNEQYTGVTPLPQEAQAWLYDSGGAGFDQFGNLAGIMINVLTDEEQPNRPPDVAFYGDYTAFADLSTYREQILTIMQTPEPSSMALAGVAALGLLAVGIHRRRSSR